MTPSRFLKDIDVSYVDWHGLTVNPFTAVFDSEFEGYTSFQRKPSYDGNFMQKKPASQPSVQQPVHRNLVPIRKASSKPADEIADASQLVAGVRIKHKLFGEGRIVDRIGDGENTKLIVEFDSGDTKTLLLKFAKLQILD